MRMNKLRKLLKRIKISWQGMMKPDHWKKKNYQEWKQNNYER